MLWLQRDFHLYTVNAFDTEKACQVGARFCLRALLRHDSHEASIGMLPVKGGPGQRSLQVYIII